MKILIIDNYDSFTFNLVHIVRELGHEVDVYRNDKITVEAAKTYDKIILSPGPGIPDEAGVMKAVIKELGPTHSILGVCLGHQGIAEVYGASLINIPKVLHGVTSEITVKDPSSIMFKNVSPTFTACHYHSWAVQPESITPELIVTAVNNEGLIMGIRHREYDIEGVQFHPESVMTPEGKQMMKNWLSYAKRQVLNDHEGDTKRAY